MEAALSAAMAIPHRNSAPNNIISDDRTFFVTASTWGKRPLLQSDRAAALFQQTILEYRAQGKFRLHEFVIMPDHFHALITVDRQTTIERAVQFIKGGFAFRAGRELGFQAPVWQKGFSEIRVADAGTYENQRHYIRNNPVVASLAARAEEYHSSSASWEVPLDPPPQRLKPLTIAPAVGTPEGVP
jgi:putative transposase